MSESIKDAAIKSDGRRHCDGCKYYPCDMEMIKFCGDIYKKGFVKGAEWEKRQEKKRNGIKICHQCGRKYDPFDSDADNKEMFCCYACECGF